MRIVECPKCGEDISETHQGAEPDVGIMTGGWFCEACDEFVEEEKMNPTMMIMKGDDVMDEEEQLVRQIEAIKAEYIKAIEPYFKRLVALRSLKPPSPIFIDRCDLHKLDLPPLEQK